MTSASAQQQAIREAIAASSKGLSLLEITQRHPSIPRRTAQRWLAQATEAGLLRAVGEGRARRYVSVAAPARAPAAFPPEIPPQVFEARESTPTLPTGIRLSGDSEDILRYVSQPNSQRTPVGYQRDFLDAYVPNRSHYLSASLRHQLHQLGRTPGAHQAAGTYSRAILGRLLIDLSWASSHLEGNTYTRLDTRQLIEHGRVAQGKAVAETQMILNHKAAIEMLVENIGDVGFDRFTLMNLHATLAENLLPNFADEGRVRQHAVLIGQSVYRPLPNAVQIDEALALLLAKASAIEDPFEQSFFALVHLPYLQPFADVNKRTARLAANLPLFRANLCPLTFLDVPEGAYSRAMLGIYEMTRVELLRDLYVWAYERSTQEYLVLRQNIAQPEPGRLAWRELIRQVVREVVTQPEADPLTLVDRVVAQQVPEPERIAVRALIVEELSRLHEGVLARYGLRPSEWMHWKARRPSMTQLLG